MTRALPHEDWRTDAENLLSRYPNVDRGELLKNMTAFYFYQRRAGNKREERAACDFLNEVQDMAARQAAANKPNPKLTGGNPSRPADSSQNKQV